MDHRDWDSRYAATELMWTAGPNRFVVEQLQALPPARALDLAAGEGRNARWLASQGWQVTAVDFSAVAVERGRQLGEARGLELTWVVADVLDYEPGARGFELVLIAYLHLPWPAMERAIRRAAEAVAPGGTFFLVGHDRDNLERGHGGPPSADVLYAAEQVAACLDGLSIESATQVERPVDAPEGERVALDCMVRAQRPA